MIIEDLLSLNEIDCIIKTFKRKKYSSILENNIVEKLTLYYETEEMKLNIEDLKSIVTDKQQFLKSKTRRKNEIN